MPRKEKHLVAVLLGKRIRDLRRARGLTQAELGELAGGMDEKYVGVIERGEQNITIATAHKLARAMNVPLRELFGAGPAPSGPRLSADSARAAALVARMPVSARRLVLAMLSAAAGR